jgi:nicotinamidase-related amidase
MFCLKPKIRLDDKLPIVLVIVDMQQYFIDGFIEAGYPRTILRLIRTLQKLIKAANVLKIPTIFIEHRFIVHYYSCRDEIQERQPTIPQLFELSQRRLLIERNHNNGFLHTYMDRCSGFNPLLQKLGAKSLIMAGVNAYSCVLSTTGTANFLGYQIITADDIIASDREYDHRRSYTQGDFSTTYFDNCNQLIKALTLAKNNLNGNSVSIFQRRIGHG